MAQEKTPQEMLTVIRLTMNNLQRECEERSEQKATAYRLLQVAQRDYGLTAIKAWDPVMWKRLCDAREAIEDMREQLRRHRFVSIGVPEVEKAYDQLVELFDTTLRLSTVVTQLNRKIE